MSPELVVLSHLRWTFVWQRPQQLVSRLAAGFERTWFVEEPEPVEGLTEAVLRVESHEHVTRVWLAVPAGEDASVFTPAATKRYEAELAKLLGNHPDRTVWLCTPMALDLARSLQPTHLVYDVMDDLAAGLPVVSTRVPDVVSDYTGIVELRDDAGEFAQACRHGAAGCRHARAERARPILAAQHWDTIAGAMSCLVAAQRQAATRESA
ncbi:MAG: hypothetical protein M3535_09510 [Actinomycetota bacterium]|nr:hypothetical protein [Actinomycetota bacterium]